MISECTVIGEVCHQPVVRVKFHKLRHTLFYFLLVKTAAFLADVPLNTYCWYKKFIVVPAHCRIAEKR